MSCLSAEMLVESSIFQRAFQRQHLSFCVVSSNDGKANLLKSFARLEHNWRLHPLEFTNITHEKKRNERKLKRRSSCKSEEFSRKRRRKKRQRRGGRALRAINWIVDTFPTKRFLKRFRCWSDITLLFSHHEIPLTNLNDTLICYKCHQSHLLIADWGWFLKSFSNPNRFACRSLHNFIERFSDTQSAFDHLLPHPEGSFFRWFWSFNLSKWRIWEKRNWEEQFELTIWE